MKASALLPSVAILIAGGSWLVWQQFSISSIEYSTEGLSQRVEATKARTPLPAGVPPVKAEPVKQEPFNWQEMLTRPAGMDPREGMRFRERLNAMSLAEIIATLDEIAGLDLPEEPRNKLTSMFVGGLTAKDPRATLDRFYKKPGPRFGFGPADQHLKYALAGWASKDPAAATAWLDSKVANGDLASTSLEGIHQVRMEFELEMIPVLAAANPAVAEKRLVAMTEPEAARVLERLLSKDRDQRSALLALAKMARTTLPEKRAGEVLANEASFRAYKGRENVLAYLTAIQATPAERHAAIRNAASSLIYQLGKSGPVTPEGINDLRSWVQANQTGSTGLILGNAIAQAMSSDTLDAAGASALLLGEFGKAPDDDLIIGFLNNEKQCPSEMARELVGRISDPAKRAEMLEKLR